MRFIQPITNFGSGELSDELFGRIDVEEYRSGLSLTENCLLDSKGSAEKRIGSKRRGLVGITGDAFAVNVLEFTLENGNTVFLEFAASNTDGFTLRILDQNLLELNYTATFVLSLTGTALLYGWNGAAFGNRVFVTNYTGTVPLFFIDFSNTSNIIISQYNLLGLYAVPFQDTNNDTTKKVRVLNANTAGPYIIEANWNAFTADHVGHQIMITGLTNTNDHNRVASEVYHITEYISPTQVRGFARWISSRNWTILANISAGATFPASPTSNWFDDWRLSAWGPITGYPKTITSFEGRLLYGGTRAKPSTLFASKINDPFFMQDVRVPQPAEFRYASGDLTLTISWQIPYTADDGIQTTDPYQFTLSSKDGAPVTFLDQSRFGVVGTSSRQYFLDGDGSVVSQLNIGVRQFSTKSSYQLLSVPIDNTVFYTDATRTKIYMYLYNETNGSYISKEVTLLFGKFSSNNFVFKMKFSRKLNSILLLTSNGDCVCLKYSQETRVLGFTNFFKASDSVKMVDYASLSTTDNKDVDLAVFSVDGKLVYHTFSDYIIEGLVDPKILELHRDDIQYLDQLITFDEMFTDQMEVLDGYTGTLAVYATNGTTVEYYEYEVDGPETITLPQSYKSWAYGMRYSFQIATMPVEAGQSYQTAQLGLKRIDQALIRTSHCDSIKVGTDGYNYELVPITDNKGVFEMIGSPEYDHIVYIRHDDIGPCKINNITLKGVNNDA